MINLWMHRRLFRTAPKTGGNPYPLITINCLFVCLPASEHSLVLKEIEVPLWPHDACNGALQAQFGPAYHLPDTAVCAGAEGRDACDVSRPLSKMLFMLLICLIFS